MTAQFDTVYRFVSAPDVPETARRRAALLLIDTLGVGAGATALRPSRIARDFAVDFHAAGSPDLAAPLLFDGRFAAVPGAAFAAATQIDNLDGHDGFNPVKGHIGCAVVPALLAFSAKMPDLAACDALDALVIAYEVGARAGLALHATVSDYHTSGAWNALAVAALGCRLRGASKAQLREALGIAEYHGPRSQMMREIAHPTMLHDGSGMGALTGSMAALLALRGFEGAPAITVEAAEAAPFWQDLGARWTIDENYIKPYPICRWAHAPLDALDALMRQNNLAHGDIDTLRIGTFTESAALYADMPTTTGQAQYSLHFAMATLWRYGHVGPEHIAGTGLTDVEVARLIPRISVRVEARHNARFPMYRTADVTVLCKDGRRFESGDTHARGGLDAPLSEEEVARKFHNFAGPTLGHDRAASIWAMREKLLEPGTRFAELAALVTPAP
ncbi:MmgE/PrpD family protein [Roseobacter sp. YSTF-M11]|uniref:MmgE/PrpD family protein n=1 Tax=Roseobacter insulae TaxID=2859783 RepID=A0A9X1FU75_9RHOB|nr:MmgE/PrpD family protein [Roseobacter insulae]MBW4707155.1 MmgE/PrpD family protein [Roseobacter insulae]